MNILKTAHPPMTKVVFFMDGRAFLFVNGELSNGEAVRKRIQPTDFLIGVDGGVKHLLKLGMRPHLMIGDFDSVEEKTLSEMKSLGIEILRFSPKKDETDLELAIYLALERGFKKIIIVAATGGRIDQTLGNIALLSDPNLADLDIRMFDGQTELFIIRDQAELFGKPGDGVSLIPLCSQVVSVNTTHLLYPLHNETLFQHKTRGISNVMQAATAKVQIQSGELLCIHIFQM
ncbi:MAG: thiamine diphosphokinase [Anaerolineaceae bacterium]